MRKSHGGAADLLALTRDDLDALSVLLLLSGHHLPLAALFSFA